MNNSMTIITAIIILTHYLNYNAILGTLTDSQNHKNIFLLSVNGNWDSLCYYTVSWIAQSYATYCGKEDYHKTWMGDHQFEHHRSNKPSSKLLFYKVQQTLPYSSPIHCSHFSERNDWGLWSLQEAADLKKADFKHFPQFFLSRHQKQKITNRNNIELPKWEAGHFSIKSTSVVFINKR